jgi:hypothetical protein
MRRERALKLVLVSGKGISVPAQEGSSYSDAYHSVAYEGLCMSRSLVTVLWEYLILGLDRRHAA